MRNREKRLKQIEDFISNYLLNYGKSPRLIDISNGIGVPVTTVSYDINNILKKEGRVVSDFKGNIMTSKWKDMINSCVLTPIVGEISCGLPILADENVSDYVPLPKQIVGNGSFFILKAKGNSMLDAGINEGDYVVVRIQNTASKGDIVVALIDDEATLKSFYPTTDPHLFRLHPENTSYDDIIVKDLQIQGVAVNVIKKL